MSKGQTAISFKLPVELKQKIDEVIKKNDITMTALVLDYFRRRAQAEEEAEARQRPTREKLVEIILLAEEGLYAGIRNEAGRRNISVTEYLHRLCEAATRGESGPVFKPEEYPDFSKLVDCVRKAYLDDHSPVDALLRLYPSLSPSQIPIGQLFTAAIAAVAVDQVLSERVDLGLKLWREKGRGGR